MYLTKQDRETPEVACDLFIGELEIEVLKRIKYRGEYAAQKGKGLSLRDAILTYCNAWGICKGQKQKVRSGRIVEGDAKAC